MINLRFNEIYKSIVAFPNVELPSFTVITGPNGSGKTHLLEAIKAGKISSGIEIDPRKPNSSVRSINGSDISPANHATITDDYVSSKAKNAIEAIYTTLNDESFKSSIREIIRPINLPEKYFINQFEFLKLTHQEMSGIIAEYNPTYRPKPPEGKSLPPPSAADHVTSYIKSLVDQAIRNSKAIDTDFYERVTLKTGKPIASVTETDLANLDVEDWGDVELFKQSFGLLFQTYRIKWRNNREARFFANEYPEEGYTYLSDEYFLKKEGEPPWDKVNRLLSQANLDFRIAVPEYRSKVTYRARLIKLKTGDEVEFSSLSSGERVIFSFVNALYYSNEPRQRMETPKLLLMDEFDAHLHPSMASDMIDILTKVIVEEYGIKVIATTHSPTTVALTPEESLFEMQPNGRGLKKITTSEALNKLTYGVPTICINYGGRRQVFVESRSDAQAYSLIYEILKSKIDSGRSLDFIATGHETNGGCGHVYRIVNELTEFGNSSAFGLVDRDRDNTRRGRIFLLSDNCDGIENLIIDPLALTLSIYLDCFLEAKAMGVTICDSFQELLDADGDTKQRACDIVVNQIIGSNNDGLIEHKYAGGLILHFSRFWSDFDDHDLEKMVLNSFKIRNSGVKRFDSLSPLVSRIISGIYMNFPQFIRVDFEAVFRSILNFEPH